MDRTTAKIDAQLIFILFLSALAANRLILNCLSEITSYISSFERSKHTVIFKLNWVDYISLQSNLQQIKINH